MTIDEAIRLLRLDFEGGCPIPPADLDKAEQLGIEALKAVKKFQSMGSKINPLRLPGETE